MICNEKIDEAVGVRRARNAEENDEDFANDHKADGKKEQGADLHVQVRDGIGRHVHEKTNVTRV